MNVLKKNIANLLGFLLLLLFGKAAIKQFDRQILSIYFHNPSAALFSGIVRFLVSNGFQFIDEETYLQIYTGKKEMRRRMVFVSFDDAWQGNLKLMPIIEKYQIPVSFFIPVKPIITGNYWWEYAPAIITNNKEITSVESLKKMPNKMRIEMVNSVSNVELERSCMDLSELKKLSQHPLVSIGSHTYHHPITIQCTDEELEFQYRESKRTLENWLGIKIQSFSYPNGDFDCRDIQLLKKYDYKMAFTVQANFPDKSRSVYLIPRVSMNTKGGKYENIARLLRIWHRYVQPLQNFKLKHSIFKLSFSKA